ncbi:MAG: sugar phosphate nucleotidyltransferase [bacterium]|nr:sugar phosphate nucleotidyltransferase [bacterium]
MSISTATRFDFSVKRPASVGLRSEIVMVIPCAGNGTRQSSWSSRIAKELIPVPSNGFTKAAVHDLIDKALKAGIILENIFLVISDEKDDIKNYFQKDTRRLEAELRDKGKEKFAQSVEEIPFIPDEQFILQSGPYGNATPLDSAAKKIGTARWILYMFPDDLFLTDGKNDIEQMIEAHEKTGGSIFATKRVIMDKEYDQYGIVDGRAVEGTGGKLVEVSTIIEKPGKAAAPSDLASVSGFIFDPIMWQIVEEETSRFNSAEENMIQPMIQQAIDHGWPFFAVKIDGNYHDTGNHADYAKLWAEVA